MTLCKYDVFILNDLQTHWLQCVLPLNVYLRKVVVVIYCWLILLICYNLKDILDFVIFLVKGKRFVKSLIKDDTKKEENNEDVAIRKLNFDTLLLVKLLKSNTNKFYASAIATNLYKNKDKTF